jgi:hypothetical protein
MGQGNGPMMKLSSDIVALALNILSIAISVHLYQSIFLCEKRKKKKRYDDD